MNTWDTGRLFAETPYQIIGHDGPIQSIVFPNEPYRGAPTEVFAYLGIPPAAGNTLPGMICVHGGGGRAYKQWVEQWVGRGYAAIAMDLSGCDAEGQRLAKGGPAQSNAVKFDTSAGWQDMWTYHAIAAILRANTILRSIPAVDPDRIGITGISWGGYLTCIAAGIDPRLACAIPVYGCGYLQEGSAKEWMALFAAMTPAQRQTWHTACDPSVYLGQAVLPMLFVSGTNDVAYPLNILKMSCALPKGPVTLCIRLEMPHGHEAGWAPSEIPLFADQHLRHGTPLPHISGMVRDGRMVSAEFQSRRPIQNATLLYTPERHQIWSTRKWRNTPAVLDRNRVRADLPRETAAYFLAIEDDRGVQVNTPHAEAGPV